MNIIMTGQTYDRRPFRLTLNTRHTSLSPLVASERVYDEPRIYNPPWLVRVSEEAQANLVAGSKPECAHWVSHPFATFLKCLHWWADTRIDMYKMGETR